MNCCAGRGVVPEWNDFGAPVVHSWFSVHSVHCRDPQSVLQLTLVQILWSAQGAHGPGKGGDGSDHGWKRKEQLSADKNKYNPTLPFCITIGKHF